MLQEIDKRFNQIVEIFEQNKSSTYLIKKAYNTARDLHKDQTRKSGEPYLMHPVEVALILSKLGLDENVISAALLHDVVEDCDYSVETLKKEFNNNVAEMVDCVSAIDKQKFVFNVNDLYEDENFEKASIEEQSFKKLIEMGKRNPLGFLIKFADRLHNLRTIECFSYSKQLEKVKETEKWIIPIAKILNAEYFYRAIENECFKIKNQLIGARFFEHYSSYHNSNVNNVVNLEIKLKEIFSKSNIKDVKIKEVREYKIHEDLLRLFKNINISKISQGQILKVTNYNIYLLYENNKYEDVIIEVLNKLNFELKELKIIDAKIGNFTKKPYFQLEDKFKNKFNLYVESYVDYVKQRNGTVDGQDNVLFETENIDNLNVELMKIQTMTGEIKFVPKESTVLDFAFKIHKEIGLGFKYAIINNSKTKQPPFAKLYDNDKVEIVFERDETGEIIKNAKLKWLAYVNTDFAKKCLIKYFEQQIKTRL